MRRALDIAVDLALVLAALAMLGCFHGCATTPHTNALKRAMAETLFRRCVSAYGSFNDAVCVQDSRAYCKASGLEPGCAWEGRWTEFVRPQPLFQR